MADLERGPQPDQELALPGMVNNKGVVTRWEDLEIPLEAAKTPIEVDAKKAAALSGLARSIARGGQGIQPGAIIRAAQEIGEDPAEVMRRAETYLVYELVERRAHLFHLRKTAKQILRQLNPELQQPAIEPAEQS